MNKADAEVERFLDRIFIARGHPVIRDSDLAELYETTTKALNQQVQRNMDRFDDLFAFRLTDDEWSALRSHDVTSKKGRGGRRYAPIVFTQEGMLMAATVVRSPRPTETVKMMVRVFRDVFPQYFSGSARIETKSASSGKRSLLLDSIVDAIRDIGKIGIDPDTDATVASELGKLPSAISEHVQSRLERPGVENEEARARVRKLDSESARSRAEAHKANAEALKLRMDALHRAVEAFNLMEGRDTRPIVDMMHSMIGYGSAGRLIDISPKAPEPDGQLGEWAKRPTRTGG